MSSQTQTWDPEGYQANAGYVAELGKPLLKLLAPKRGERVLDLGCGDGVLTLEIARLGCEVVGIDASKEMVEAARNAGIDAHVRDGARLSFETEFDAVFTNATLHWIQSPEAVISGVWRALRPGGRFVGEFGGRGNVAKINAALDAAINRRGITVSNYLFFPSAAVYAAMLSEAGFTVRSCETFERPTPLPGDVRGWLETFAKTHICAVAEPEREAFISEVVSDLRRSLTDGKGNWFADYVRLRFNAEKGRAAA
jgi:SAM-dependent methyltransferase